MLNTFFKDKATIYFVIISALLLSAIFTIEKINGRFWLNDFKVMYMAAQALLNGQQVYGIPFGLATGFYKYSPFTLLFFVPFTLLPYEAAATIDFTIIAICTLTILLLLDQIVTKYFFPDLKKSFLALLGIFMCIAVHMVRELHLGNTNIILLLLLSFSLKYSLESKAKKSGALLAVVILTKPYFIICLLPFLLYKKYRIIFNCVISLTVFIALSFILIGITRSALLYSEWISAMRAHSDYLFSRHTVFSILDYYTGIQIPGSYGLAVLGLISILLFGCFWLIDNSRRSRTNVSINTNQSLIIYFYLLIAIVPNILITDTEHFLFALPLISILVLYLKNVKNYFWIILFILLMFMYGGDSSDLIGKKLSHKFEEIGLLGISNLILIVSIIVLHLGKRNNWNLQEEIKEQSHNS